MSEQRIGMIGLDTSHAVAFTKLLNDPTSEHHVPGGQVVMAFPGGSPSMELSASRVEGYTKQLQEEFGVEMVEDPETAAEHCDAILLESVDGRVHLEQFRRIAPYGKPTFIDKPLTVSFTEAQEIVSLASKYQVPIMSCSALRYAEALTTVLANDKYTETIGADCYGPMSIEPTQPGLFWYGIHTVEMLYKVFGPGCRSVQTFTNADHDVVVGQWEDGRIGTVRGNRSGNNQFGALVHTNKGSELADVSKDSTPFYASLLKEVMQLFQTGQASVDSAETLEVIRFIEAANESRDTGEPTAL